MNETITRLSETFDAAALPQLAEWLIAQALAIQQIAAPTFAERARAEWIETQFRALGLQDVSLDTMNNVYGRLPGSGKKPALMLSAHSDTIFSAETDLTIRRDGDLIYGPGLGDNSIGVAALLALARYFSAQSPSLPCDLWFVATAREEGLGDLGGMRAAFARLGDRVRAVINVEGLAFGHVYHTGIAVRRLHITARTEGGHSWLHFGRPSAIHGIVQLGARIVEIRPPHQPRTTYNIGMIEGGEAINAIATHAGLWLDMRSEERGALETLEAAVHHHIRECTQPELQFKVEVVGDRPAGRIPADHPLVQAALAALNAVGVRGTLETGSTDCNIPLSEGCPAVTVGVTCGGNAHRLDEYIECAPIETGLKQLILLTTAVAGRTLSQEDNSL